MIASGETEAFRSTITLKRFSDFLEWYQTQLEITPANLSFYRNSLEGLLAIQKNNITMAPSSSIVMYEPQIELEKLIVRPTAQLDIIDMLNNARTSPDLPLIIANMG